MNLKRSNVSSQILILSLAGLALLLVSQMASAQSMYGATAGQPLVAQTQSNVQNQNNSPQVLQTGMPQRSFGRRMWENTSLTYYQQFLGPTADGNTSRTYNVFQEGIDTPNSGYAPLQSFHALNLRHQINTRWAVGATISMSSGYTKPVTNKYNNGGTFQNSGKAQFFNARAYVSLPSVATSLGTWYNTISIEAPTSQISQDNNMKYGWVAASSFSFNVPDLHWSVGIMAQAYRMYYQSNVLPPPFQGGQPTPLQTLILSGGPYVNYRFSDKWMVGEVITLDWDQRGVQSGTRDFNNNLPHRTRTSLTYFPQKLRYLQSVGLFAQSLVKFRPSTTAIGADFSLRF